MVVARCYGWACEGYLYLAVPLSVWAIIMVVAIVYAVIRDLTDKRK